MCHKGTRDVISSDIYGVACPLSSIGVINIEIEPTAHRKSLPFHRKATNKNFIFYFYVIHHFLGNSMLNSNLKSVIKIEN